MSGIRDFRSSMRYSISKKLLKWAAHLVLVLILLSPFVSTVFVISGNSMEPTLLHGETLLVDHFSLSLFAPRRGQIIVFHNPHEKAYTDVKRVIGLPGETVEVLAESLVITHVDGTREEYSGDTFFGGGVRGLNGLFFKMKLGPEDYFVLGDNREASRDSRFFGAIQKIDFVGRPWLRIFPVSNFKLFP